MQQCKRRKSFSHKVRSGCITCKRRRVKCDEGKPHCLRCINGGHKCVGYAVPQAKIFTLEDHAPTALASLDVEVSRSDGIELCSSLSANMAFRGPEEHRSLEHWMLKTSPMLAHYGPMGDFYTTIVPQLARESVPIKNMMICLSLVHENIMNGDKSARRGLNPRGIYYYNSAIKNITDQDSPKLHAMVFSLIAWTMEMMRENFSTALLHLRGSQTMAADYGRESGEFQTQDIFQDAVTPTILLAQGLTSMRLFKDAVEDHKKRHRTHYKPQFWTIHNFSSIAGARYALLNYLDNMARTSPTVESDERFVELKFLLSSWFENVSKWDQESATSAELTALLLLFLIAMSLLPSRDVAGYSYSMNPSIVSFVVKRAGALFEVNRNARGPTVELCHTLSAVLRYVMLFFPQDRSIQQAKLLLQRMNTSSALETPSRA